MSPAGSWHTTCCAGQRKGAFDAMPGSGLPPRPAVWGEDAGEFRPDRLLFERSRGRPPHSYQPFGTGERACIGQQFALREAVLVLARLVHRYDITADPCYQLAISERFTLMPKGFQMRLARRTPAKAGLAG